MKKIFLYLVFIQLIGCTSENNNIENENATNKFENFYSIFNIDTKNKILITNYSNLKDNESFSTISYKSLNVNDNKIVKLDNLEFLNNGSEYINGYTIWQYNDNRLNSLFGNKVNFTLKDKNQSEFQVESENQNVNIYLPKIINVTVSNLNNGRLQVGTIVTWDIDVLNTNGVLIGIEYLPHLQFDENVKNNNPNVIYEGKVVNDSGSYVISESDLVKYPDNATLTFYIGRSSIVVTNTGEVNDDTGIGVYTYRSADFIITK